MNEPLNERALESRLDRAVHAASAQAVDPEIAAQAAERVWERLSDEIGANAESAVASVREASCAGFRALIDDQIAGRLDGAQQLLLDDHLTSCATCRKAAWAARSGEPVGERGKMMALRSTQEGGARRMSARWAIAAALIVAVGLTALGVLGYLPFGADPVMAEVSQIDGGLYRLEGDENVALASGDEVRAGDVLRTARGGTSVLTLTDGSTVELAERSAVSLGRSPGATRVNLDRGNVIVHAADQRDGRLVVATADAVSVVKGTIFSVRHGMKGTRVSVLEGEVEVEGVGEAQTLGPGEQMVTRSGVDPVAIGDEFAWSRDADAYVELATELAQLERDVTELLMPGARHDSRLLRLVPDDTAVYVALPNLGLALTESRDLLDQRMAESDVLEQWWDGTVGASSADDEMVKAITQIGALSEFLGEELVVALVPGVARTYEAPLLLAETLDAAALVAGIDKALLDIGGDAGGDLPSIQIVDDAWGATEASTGQDLYLWLGDGVLAASPDVEEVLAARSRAERDLGSASMSPFVSRVRDAYSQGVDWLIAVDLEQAVALSTNGSDVGLDPMADMTTSMKQLGVDCAETLIVTRQLRGDRDETEAELLFSGARGGAAAWLAEPGPMGSLAFVAPDAYAFAAFVIDDPSAVVEEMFGFVRESEPDLWQEMEDADDGQGHALFAEFAAALGGEIAVAIDGPLLPEPNVKLIAEVDDPRRLQAAMATLTALAGGASDEHGRLRLSMSEQSVRGATFHTLSSPDLDTTLCYGVADGYVVAARSCAHVDRAMEYGRSGVNLGTSSGFQAMLPGGGNLGFSALAYQQLGETIGSLAGLALGSGALSEDQSAAMQQAASGMTASLAYAYAEHDRIRVAHTAEGGLPWLSLFAILGEGGW